MDPQSPKDSNDNRTPSSPIPETPNLQDNLATLSLDERPSTEQPTPNPNSTDPQNPTQQNQQNQAPTEPPNEEEPSKTYRINTLRQDSDEPDEDEEGEESSNIKPDELLNVVFNFDMPREVDLKVKIKGDFNVTVLA